MPRFVILSFFLFSSYQRQTGTATESEGIPDGWMGLDAGLKSRELFRQTVLEAKTILWNGYLPPSIPINVD